MYEAHSQRVSQFIGAVSYEYTPFWNAAMRFQSGQEFRGLLGGVSVERYLEKRLQQFSFKCRWQIERTFVLI